MTTPPWMPPAQPGGNWETQHYNFGGMRKVGVPAAGPNAGGFQSFDTAEQGVGAIAHQLMRYQIGATTGAPLTTIRQIVSTWAPPNENPTAALIERASKIVGVEPDKPINLNDSTTMAKMIEATIRNEQGGKLPVSGDIIRKVANAPETWQPSAGVSVAAESRRLPGRFGGMGPRVPGDSDLKFGETPQTAVASTAIAPPPAPGVIAPSMQSAQAPTSVAPVAFSLPGAPIAPVPNLQSLYKTALGRIFGQIPGQSAMRG